MQIGVYGTGYLGTVAAACLADFGTPVTVFDEDSSRVAALAEGNTPLYDAPRSAEYCGLNSLRLKHQGNNPTGSFKDTGMTVAVTQALKLGFQRGTCVELE